MTPAPSLHRDLASPHKIATVPLSSCSTCFLCRWFKLRERDHKPGFRRTLWPRWEQPRPSLTRRLCPAAPGASTPDRETKSEGLWSVKFHFNRRGGAQIRSNIHIRAISTAHVQKLKKVYHWLIPVSLHDNPLINSRQVKTKTLLCLPKNIFCSRFQAE